MRSYIILLLSCIALSLAIPGDARAKDPERKPNAVEEWLFRLAMRAAPPKHAWRPPAGPHSKETPKEREARYREIVYDIYRVTFYEGNRPIPGMSRLHTAGFLLGMAVGESGLAPDADLGPCYMKGMRGLRCDGGRAVGLLQVHIPKGHGYSKEQREKAQRPYWENRWRLITKGLKEIGGSIGLCHRFPVEERLAAYGAGTCESDRGRYVSRRRWKLIRRIMSRAVPPSQKIAKKLIIKKRSNSKDVKVAQK